MNVKPYATTGSEHYRELNFKQADGHHEKEIKEILAFLFNIYVMFCCHFLFS